MSLCRVLVFAVRSAAAILALTVLVARTPCARADETSDEQAKIYYENGSRLYDEGRYEDAIAAWKEAYRLSERPLLLYNIANAEERVGRYREALDHLNRYRAFAEPSERDALDRRITNLERRLAETPATVPGATPAATAPATEDGGPRILPIALFTVGGAGIVTGGVFGGLAVAARGDANAECLQTDTGLWCKEEVRTALQHDERRSLIADIAFGVGALGIIGGTVTLLVPGSDTALTVGISPNHLLIGGQF